MKKHIKVQPEHQWKDKRIPEGETDVPRRKNTPSTNLTKNETPEGFANLGDGVLFSQSEILDLSEGADSYP